MGKILVLSYVTTRGPLKRVRINDPATLSRSAVEDEAGNIMSSDVFDENRTGRLLGLKSAEIITTSTTPVVIS